MHFTWPHIQTHAGCSLFFFLWWLASDLLRSELGLDPHDVLYPQTMSNKSSSVAVLY